MKKKFLGTLLGACFLLVLFVSLSVNGRASGQTQGNQTVKTGNVKKTDTKKTTIKRGAPAYEMLDRAFAGSNVLFSPVSLDYALAMLKEGADGDAKTGLHNYLKSDGFSLLPKTEGVEVANSIWLNKDCRPDRTFTNAVKKTYGAGIKQVDFSKKPAQAAEKMNNWTSQKTHGLIPKLITMPETLRAMKMVLCNALYFKSEWVEEMAVSDKEEAFKNLDGKTAKVNYLSDTVNTYYENDKATAFAKRYRNGMVFLGILPKKKGDFTAESLDVPGLLKKKNTAYDVKIKMPELNFESTLDLDKYLKKGYGLDNLFRISGDLARLGGKDYFVSSILQKTKIKLNRFGTEAAAVTAIFTANGALMEKPEVKEVFLNRPYLFLIYDEETAQALFIGKVVQI